MPEPLNEAQFTPEQREQLMELTRLQLTMAKAQLEVLPIKLAALEDPTPENMEALALISRLKLAEARKEHAKMAVDVIVSAVDVPGLKAMLPMIIAVLASKINLPVILGAFGIDPDNADELLQLLKKYISL